MRKISLIANQNDWKKDIEPFQTPSAARSWWQLINSIIPFAALWCGAYFCLSISVWLTLLLTIPTAGFLMRTFIIFHDCCHYSFFKNRKTNDIVGVITGLLTFFPFHQWRYEHSVHHAGNGNLNRRGMGDITTLTVGEYLKMSPVQRLRYRLYRNPIIMFGFGPIVLFLFQYRTNRKGAGRRERFNTHLTTAVLIATFVVGCLTLGWKSFLLIEGPILYWAGLIGIWLFYVQHQFEDSYFEKEENWDYVTAALKGSSFYKLPKVLQWITGNIGFHHIHHLGPRVPNYNLQRIYDKVTYLQEVSTVGLFSSFRTLRFRLWDEEKKKFIGFKALSGLKSSTMAK